MYGSALEHECKRETHEHEYDRETRDHNLCGAVQRKHAHTHTHTDTDRERQRERTLLCVPQAKSCIFICGQCGRTRACTRASYMLRELCVRGSVWRTSCSASMRSQIHVTLASSAVCGVASSASIVSRTEERSTRVLLVVPAPADANGSAAAPPPPDRKLDWRAKGEVGADAADADGDTDGDGDDEGVEGMPRAFVEEEAEFAWRTSRSSRTRSRCRRPFTFSAKSRSSRDNLLLLLTAARPPLSPSLSPPLPPPRAAHRPSTVRFRLKP